MRTRLASTTIGRAALAAGVAVSALAYALPAAAEDLFTRGEAIGSGFGRAGAAIMGPGFLVVGAGIFLASIWYLFIAGQAANKGRGYYGLAVVGIIAGSLMAGIGGFSTMGAQTFTGGAPTASNQPFTFGR